MKHPSGNLRTTTSVQLKRFSTEINKLHYRNSKGVFGLYWPNSSFNASTRLLYAYSVAFGCIVLNRKDQPQTMGLNIVIANK